MIKVAITGNIAAGKTAVEDILKIKGFNVLDTDIVAHDLLKNKLVQETLLQTFSEYDIVENGIISRKKLAGIVFKDVKIKQKLEDVLHPKIKIEIEKFFSESEFNNEKIVFVSVPQLYEAKFEKMFDKVVLIYAPDSIRLKRLMNRGSIELADAQIRIQSQLSQDEKVNFADYIIYNDKTIDDLDNNIKNTIVKLF